MQRLEVAHFGPVEDASIDLQKITIFIGPQASGKSTLAKLVYFFQKVPDLITDALDAAIEQESIDFTEIFVVTLRNDFQNLFGWPGEHPDMTICYHYGPQRTLTLTAEADNNYRLHVSFENSGYWNDLKTFARNTHQALKEAFGSSATGFGGFGTQHKRQQVVEEIAAGIKDLFGLPVADRKYMIAGRQATVGYGEAFRLSFFRSLGQSVDKANGSHSKGASQSIELQLMLGFLEHSAQTRDFFSSKGGSIKQLSTQADSTQLQKKLKQLEQIELNLVKARYIGQKGGEYLELAKLGAQHSRRIPLQDASSGQQEVVRLVLDAAKVIYEDSTVARVYEEPEAHLFPEGQQELVNLMAFLANTQAENHIIITTHSPYILTAFNVLLFAQQVGKLAQGKHAPEVEALIPPDFWLNASDFGAYSLGRAYDSKGLYCLPIFSAEEVAFEHGYLDTASETINNLFKNFRCYIKRLYMGNLQDLAKALWATFHAPGNHNGIEDSNPETWFGKNGDGRFLTHAKAILFDYTKPEGHQGHGLLYERSHVFDTPEHLKAYGPHGILLINPQHYGFLFVPLDGPAGSGTLASQADGKTMCDAFLADGGTLYWIEFKTNVLSKKEKTKRSHVKTAHEQLEAGIVTLKNAMPGKLYQAFYKKAYIHFARNVGFPKALPSSKKQFFNPWNHNPELYGVAPPAEAPATIKIAGNL